MILETMQENLQSLSNSKSEDDSEACRVFNRILCSLIDSDYACIFQNAFGAINELQPILQTCLSPQVDKLGYSILRVAVAISKLHHLLSTGCVASLYPDAASKQTPKQIIPSSPPRFSPKAETPKRVNSSESFSPSTPPPARHYKDKFIKSPSLICDSTDPSDYVLCRICEKLVPLYLIDAHSKNCVLAYESSKSMKTTDDMMSKLQALARQTILRKQWPGQLHKAANLILPILHAVSLLDRAISVDTNSPDAADELDAISEALIPITSTVSQQDAIDLLQKANTNVSEKQNAATKLAKALNVVQKTVVASDDTSAPSVSKVTIADFTFVKRISSGAYSRVFLAKKNSTGDIYAIKVIPKNSLSQKNEVRRVLVEKDILLKINSPYMIKFFYSIIGEHNLYLVMEYLPGGDLYSVLQFTGSLDEEPAKIYSIQIVAALEFLRNNHIIHRDLKPDNILVDASGHLKLVDFGLSFYGMVGRSISGRGDEDDAVVGTPDYTSPEIVLAQPHSFQADYWALGALLYEFLVGVPPFHGETPTETFANIVKYHVDFEQLEDFSPEVQDFIRKLLNPDQFQRLGTNSIDEIKNHSWFSDVDWNTIDSLEPPFVPNLSNNLDTSYFEERYTFQSRDENDILNDIMYAKKDKPEQHRHSISTVSETSSNDEFIHSNEEEEHENEINQFQSVAVHQLQESTNADAIKIRKIRAASVSEDSLVLPSKEEIESFLAEDAEYSESQRRKSSRRMPRKSYMPLVLSKNQEVESDSED